MRVPFLFLFSSSPFDGLQEHAEKVKECAWVFQHAMECYVLEKKENFNSLLKEVSRMESDADVIKRRIRGHIPKGTLLQVDKFQLFRYLSEQDAVLNTAKDALNWISYREMPGIPRELEDELLSLVDAVIDPIEELSKMVAEAHTYFKTFSEEQREEVKAIIRTLQQQEHDADKVEDALKRKAFTLDITSKAIYHVVRLSETIGAIADHAQNAGDMMRAMVAR